MMSAKAAVQVRVPAEARAVVPAQQPARAALPALPPPEGAAEGRSPGAARGKAKAKAKAQGSKGGAEGDKGLDKGAPAGRAPAGRAKAKVPEEKGEKYRGRPKEDVLARASRLVAEFESSEDRLALGRPRERGLVRRLARWLAWRGRGGLGGGGAETRGAGEEG